jgi:hypothetical protein
MARTYLVFGDIEGKLDVLRVECAKVSAGPPTKTITNGALTLDRKGLRNSWP